MLERQGYRIVRVAAARVLKDADATADAIVALAGAPSTTGLRPAVPFPASGEDTR